MRRALPTYTSAIVHNSNVQHRSATTEPCGRVFNLMRFSVHDGPGIRTTVFLKGCPLRCPWCHNPESQSPWPEPMYSRARCIQCGDCLNACEHDALTWNDGPVRNSNLCATCGSCAEHCPTGARRLVGREMTVSELIADLRKDAVFFEESGGGVSFSGGEPLSQPDFLSAALDACAAEGFHRVVDTCGFAPADVFNRILPKVDLFLFDLKLIDDFRHQQLIGASNQVILKNLRLLADTGSAVNVRIPVIPGINDDFANIEGSLQLLTSLGLRNLSLLPYHEIGADKYSRLGIETPLAPLKPPSPTYMESLAGRFRSQGFAVQIGG